MTSPLISDATLAKIVRLAHASTLDHDSLASVLSAVVDERYAEAMDIVREAGITPFGLDRDVTLIAALEEANEEAARSADMPMPRTAADVLAAVVDGDSANDRHFAAQKARACELKQQLEANESAARKIGSGQ